MWRGLRRPAPPPSRACRRDEAPPTEVDGASPCAGEANSVGRLRWRSEQPAECRPAPFSAPHRRVIGGRNQSLDSSRVEGQASLEAGGDDPSDDDRDDGSDKRGSDVGHWRSFRWVRRSICDRARVWRPGWPQFQQHVDVAHPISQLSHQRSGVRISSSIFGVVVGVVVVAGLELQQRNFEVGA